jgi:SAM-dependent methyltransferase
MDTVDIKNLDWNLLWQQAKRKKTWKSKNAADWDKKAVSFAKRTSTSIYIDRFLKLLKPRQEWSILDAGCGPGTLALPLASLVRRVTGLDFSKKMLAILKQKAAEKGLSNITICHGSWEDDWQALNIVPHDMAIASRSLAVTDLKAALVKLSAHAREKVVITDRVKHGPFDPDAFAAIGRPLATGPDYIYTLNLLYQMGYLPSVDYIELEKELHYPDAREAMESYLWMFRGLDDREKKLLKNYVQSVTTRNEDGSITLHRNQAPVWAFISWTP